MDVMTLVQEEYGDTVIERRQREKVKILEDTNMTQVGLLGPI